MPDPWDSKTVIGLFCDPYVANTNLEGGHSEETLSDVSGWLKDLKSSNPKASKVLQEASHLFAEGARLGNEGRGAFGSATGAAAWCQSLRKALEGLKQGDMLLAPGGWIHNKGGHAILYLFQRVRGNEFSFAVCNTGEGVNAHPQDAGAAVFPKEKHVTSWRLTGIPAEKVLDELWLHALFKIYFTKADHHKPPMLYEVLLPMLLPNGDVRKQTDESWQTAATLQRAGSCYYKCIPAALRLILGTRGIEAPERKRLMYQLRVQQLQQIHRALGNTDLEGLSRSDLMVVECACRQVAQKVLREERVGLPAKDMEAVRELIAAVDAKVGEAHQAQREAMAARAVGISEGANPANVGYVGFPGWEALSVAWAGKGNSNYRAYSHLMGPKDSQNLGEHVDLASLRQLSGIELLRTVRTMCDCLERNGLEETSKLRIGALIEDVFLCQFPPDHSGWMDLEFDMALQKEVLQILWRLAQHYVSAVASSTTPRSQLAAQVLTMRCLHVAYETVMRRAASDGMLPTTQAILTPGGGDDVDAFRPMWSFGGDADLKGRSAASATESLPLSTPHLAEARDALQRHPLGGGAGGDCAWDASLCPQKYDARSLNSTQQLVTDLVKKVLRIPGNVLPPGHSEDWPKWTVPLGWALNSNGPIREKAPEFYWWRDLVVWCKYICLDPQCRQFKGVWNANDAQIRWSVGYCQPCEILKAQMHAFNIKFDMLSKGFVGASGADLTAAGLKGAHSEDDVIHAPTLPDFGKAFAQEEAEHVLSSLTVPYLRVPLLLHFLAADRLHALKQTSVQQLLWAAMLEPAAWVDDQNPPLVEQAPERESKLGAAYGLLHNEVAKGLGTIAAPFCSLCDQAEELASLAPPEEFDGPPANILLFFVRLCSRFLDQLHHQKEADKHPELTKHLTTFLEDKASKHLQRYIESSSQEVDVRCRMHAHLALTCFHRDVSIPDNMVVLLSSCAYVLSWYERDFHEEFGTELQMVFEVVQRRRCEVISALQAAGDNLKVILDQVAKITSNFFAGRDEHWREDGTGAYRCKKERGGDAVFNAQTCTLWLQSGLLRPIPPKLQRLPQFAEFFRQHPVKLQPTCRPMRLAKNCHILSAVDDDGITLEMQWWSEIKRGGPRVESEDDKGMRWKEASDGGHAPQAVGLPWEDGGAWMTPGGVRCEMQDVSTWLRGLGKDALADIWDTLLRFAEEPGNDDEGEALEPITGAWYVQTNHVDGAKELVALQPVDRLGIVEARFACEQHPVIRMFALSDFGRHAYRSQIFCSNAAFSYAALVPNAKPRKVPLCNPQFAGRIGFLPSVESMALFDDGKRLWVPPVALQGLLPAVLTEGCRFWGICDGDSAVSFVGEPFNPPIYSSLTYSIQVKCHHGIARVTRKVGDNIWVLASPIHAPKGSQIARFANILAPLEAMSHALFWTSEDGQALTLVELPRVQLRFKPGPDPGGRGLRLFSKEFGGFYLLDRNGVHDAEAWRAATGDPRASDLGSYLAKMPHAVVLRSTAGAIRILVTNADLTRPAIKVKPFSTDLVVNRKLLVAYGLKTFLWDFHESGSLLLTSSLSGTLYLTLLTLLHRDYASCARLVGSIGFDEGISGDEDRLLKMNLMLTVTDRHPNASAIRLKLLLALIAHNPKHPLLNPDNELIAGDYADYLVKLSHVSQSCRLLLREEGSLLRNMTDMGVEFWPQAANRKHFVEACLNDSSACVLSYGDSHPAGRREGFLGYQGLSQVMSQYVKNKWYENFSVDEAEAGKSRQDLPSLIELMDRFDREDWTCSGTLFFTLYAILTGVSQARLNGKDVAQTVARLALEKFWLRMVRLSKNASGDDCRTIRTLWSIMGMHSLGTTRMLPSFDEAAKLYKESKYGCLIGHDEKGGLIWLNKLHAALEKDGGYSSAEALTPAVSCQNSPKSDRLSISEDAMPRFLPPPAPRLLDFARRSASLEGEGREVLAMLGQPLRSISDDFVCEFEESVTVPENPFTTDRLKSLPGGMTRIAGDIIKGKLDGHAVYLERASSRKGCGLKCLPQDLSADHLAPALGVLDELESAVKRAWSADLQQVVTMRAELLQTADKAPADQGDGTRFWLGRRGGIEGHLWLEWCVGAELDNERLFEGCIAAVNKVSNTASAQSVGRRVLAMMLYVCRIAQGQLALASLHDLRSAVQRAEKSGVDEVVSKELQTLAGRLAVFLGCKRNYTDSSAEISPAFLLFEYVTGFLVRKQQVTLIQKFAQEAFDGNSLVAQMIMGAGKTTCIAPMLTLLLGNDGRLVLNIVPKALLAQTRNVMRKMFGQILAKRVVTLEFSRMMGQDDPFDVQLIKQQLFDAQRDAAVVCTTPAAIKSMFLRHLELLQLNHLHLGTQKKYKAEMHKAKDSVSQTRLKKRMQDVNKEVEGNRVMAGFIGDVLAMLRNNSCALIDEVDLVLHPLKSELNFPIGNFEMYDLGCERWNLAVHLLDALFLNDEGHAAAGTFYPEIRNCVGKVGDAAAACISRLEEEIPRIVREGYDHLTLQKQPHLVLLSRPWYDKNLRRPLAEWLACWLVTRPEAEKFRQAVEFNDVCDFLSMDLSELLKSSCKARVEVKADGALGKLLTLGREWLFSLVPHVISKIDRVQYGLLTEQELQQPENQKAPSSRRLLAVPFVAKDKPSPAAEFAQPDVLIGFTVLAYRYEGLRLSDTVQMLHHLQMKSGRESGPWGSRPTCVLFERWKALGGKRYEEKGGKSSAGGLEPLSWEVLLDDEWKKLPNSITEKLREAVAMKQTKIRFKGFGAQPYEIDLEAMVQVNLKSHKKRDIRQVESSAKRGDELKLPELQALSSSTGDEESKKKKKKAEEEKPEADAGDAALAGGEVQEKKPEGHAQVAMELLGPVPEIVLWYLLTMVFDAVLRQQPYKLSATGQELGSSMLFSSRIGFSGTPSSLLPEDLGTCLFEAENEGEILSVLSDEQHVVPPLIEMAADWSPESILDTVATSKDPVYHCLIDTGALVMGFTNEEVAKVLLKKLPEELFDGVAYFDDRDAPMVILRGAVKPALLSEAGVPMDRRFTFFDQVHTTGTDTKQPLQSYAALTLSASMTFRDYAQGAWRMRGLGKGQKLRMMITPELSKKVSGAVRADGDLGLHDAVAFMLSNQFDSEGKQFAALQLQNLATIWRKHSLDTLMDGQEPKKREEMRPEVESFLESLRFPVEPKVREPLRLHEKMQEMVNAQAHIMNDAEKAACAKLIDAAAGGGGSEGGELGAEITRQQEKEQEKQQEKEKEVEVHVGREREREVEWPLKVLTEAELPEQVFFKLSNFKMSGLKTRLKCSGSALVSSNHTANDLASLTARRMKSVILLFVLPHSSGTKTIAVSMAEAAALRRASHLSSEHLQTASLWVGSGSKKVPESSQNLLSGEGSFGAPESGVLKALRLEAARLLLRFFNCELDFRPEEVTSTVKAIESGGSVPKQRQHFVETVLTARRREACAWRDTPLGEIVRGDSAKLEERERLAQQLFDLMSKRFKSTGDFFKVLDVNGDGVIQHEEFQRSMKKIFKGAFSAEDVRKLFIAADSRGQGNVSSQDIVQLLRLGAIATGAELPGEEPGAAPNPTMEAPADDSTEDPGSPTSPGADAGTTDDGTATATESSGDGLWGISAEATDRLVEQLTQQVNAIPSFRQTLITDLSAAHEKREKDAFIAKLLLLAGVAAAEMPDARASMLEVVEVGRGCDSSHDINAFQLTVLADLLDDAVLHSELEEMYVAAEEGGSEPLPDCLATAEKYLAKALAAWKEFPEKWSELVALSSGQDDLRKVIDYAMDTQSHRLRRLALARGLRASPAEAAAAGAVEMATAILGEVTQIKKTKAAAAAGEEDPIHTMVELGVFLLASLVKDARSGTLPKLGGADFQEAARHVWDNKQDHPQIIAALCYVLQALSLKLTKWQVQLSDGGEWSDLGAEQQLALRKATEKGDKVVHFRARGFPYEIDLKEMTQKNLKTGTSRTIQEVEVSIGALAGDAGGEEEVEAEKPYKWQVSNGKGGWWDFPEDVDTKLKEGRAAGISVVKCTIRGQHYEVDIVNMHQKNCKVGTRREIRTLEL